MNTFAAPLVALALPNIDGLGKIALFLFTLSVLVVLHEYGHFLMARRAGVHVNDFAVGFGPTLVKWTSPRSGTNYRLNLLPIGGYCAMQGEIDPATDSKDAEEEAAVDAAAPKLTDSPALVKGSFQSASPWARLSIIVAGPVANVLLAYAILLIGTLCFGEATADVKPEIGLPIPGSPAVRAGFLAGDEIVAINGHRMSSGLEILKTIHTSTGRALRITIDRHGSTQTLSVTPQKTKLDDGGTEGTIGFVPVPLYAHVPVGTAIANAGARFLDLLTSQLASYATIFTHPKENVGQLSGVIGMTAEAGVVQDLGWAPYFGLAAMISIALAILNILPFPALDGGRALLIIIEMVRGKALDAKKEALFNATGVFALMLLMLATAYHDIGNILMGKAF